MRDWLDTFWTGTENMDSLSKPDVYWVASTMASYKIVISRRNVSLCQAASKRHLFPKNMVSMSISFLTGAQVDFCTSPGSRYLQFPSSGMFLPITRNRALKMRFRSVGQKVEGVLTIRSEKKYNGIKPPILRG